jgi:alpha-mannosidase
MYHKTHWTEKKIASRLGLIQPLVYRKRIDLPPFRFCELPDPHTPPLIGADVDRSASWTTIPYNTHWGRRYMDFMLHTSFSVPSDWGEGQPVALFLPLGEAGDFSHPETLAYIDGAPYAAGDRHHQEIRLDDAYIDGAHHSLDLHGFSGLIDRQGFDFDPGLFMRPCAVVQIDQATRDFIVLARTALETSSLLDANEPAKGALLNALDAAFKLLETHGLANTGLIHALDTVMMANEANRQEEGGTSWTVEAVLAMLQARKPGLDDFYASVGPALETLRAGIAQAGPALDVEVIGTGHAHIDVAWLWTLGQTRRKAGRTFHTVLRLMEQFPEYHFTQSQPQLYDYVRQDYPGLLDAIKERVAAGQWEPIGGMWVEADCNLSGPESLARQFLLGRTFFRQHFGRDAEAPVLWLPDVFGYAWNLPQLIKEAGLEYFFTIKIGWSQYNRLPYDSFWWQGLDGTKVLTHFSTTPDFGAFASTYNAMATPAQNHGTWSNFQQKELQKTLLMAFGYGDGGGGPTREMLENIRVMNDFPGLPHMRNGSVAEFYRKLEAQSGDRLPTWNGELYLELHRGTYTTQSRNKRANRKSEFLLHDAEFLAALASLSNTGFDYPRETLRKAWELVCLNQFHDIIPGSSITPVYVESQQQYAQVAEMAHGVIDNSLAALAPAGADAVVINPTSFTRSDLAFLPGDLPAGKTLQRSGQPIAVQPTDGGAWIDAGSLAPFSLTALQVVSGAHTAPHGGTLQVDAGLLENDFVRVELDRAGDITRIFDKVNQRDALPVGAVANQFQAHEDRPINWEAWDVDIFLTDKMLTAKPAQSITVVEAGPLVATLEIHRRILNSDYVQRISLRRNSPQIDIVTDILWNERHIFLKVAFPVDVLSPTATYEIQWGNTERPTHRNTSWDWARFETCAQKWVDLSEGGYGVSVLNDCKYGHDIKENVIRISLLRSPSYPDPLADLGEHRFAYSILPHAGRWNETTVAAAYALNDPLIAARVSGQGAGGAPGSFVSCDAANVVIETVKMAEDSDGVIVRLYETQRRRGPITLTTSFPIKSAERVNLLEDPGAELAVSGNQASYSIRPYEIATLRLRPA